MKRNVGIFSVHLGSGSSEDQLSLAIGEYDHVRDVLDGTVPVPGVDLTVLRLPVEEMFYRFLVHREFDVSEASLAKIVALAAQDDRSFVALPVFPSRVKPMHCASAGPPSTLNGVVSDGRCQKLIVRQLSRRGAGPGAAVTRTSYFA